jgi:hypothetical protein
MRGSNLLIPYSLALTLLAPAIAAQSFYLPSDTPGSGLCDPLPFDGDTRYQVLVPAADLGARPAILRGLAVAPCASGVQWFWQLRVRLAHRAPGTPLSTTFDANLAGGATTVVDATFATWRITAGTWNELDVAQPFAFNGIDDLVVDAVVRGPSGVGAAVRRDATHQCVFRTGYDGQATGIDGGRSAIKLRLLAGDASTQTFGTGCRGAGATPLLEFHGVPRLGGTFVVTATTVVPSTQALLNLGTSSAEALDLTPFGAHGCWIYTVPFATIVTGTDFRGIAGATLNVPNSAALFGAVIYFQWLTRDRSANALSFTTSNYGRALIGS